MEVALFGYSGHAFVVADILLKMGYSLLGYVTKEKMLINPFQLKHIGYENDIDFEDKIRNLLLFPAIGSNFIRYKLMNSAILENKVFVNAISINATISDYATLADGIFVGHGAIINPLSFIGKGAIINTASIIEHECNIGEYTHIAPGAVIAGNVSIGATTFIGANSVIKQGITIGKNVILGAGAVVINNIGDNEIWVGNPAKKMRDNEVLINL